MNFRYHAIAIAFLALVVHFHNSESFGTLSLAQQAPPADAAKADASVEGSKTPVVAATAVPKKPKVVEDKIKINEGSNETFTIKLEEKEPNNSGIMTVKERLNKQKSPDSVITKITATTEAGITLTLKDCDCDVQVGPIDQVMKSEAYESLIEQFGKLAEKEIEKAKTAKVTEEKKAAECRSGDFDTRMECTEEKLADSEIDEKTKDGLRDRAFTLLQTEMSNPEKVEDALSFVKDHKDLVNSFDISQRDTLTSLGQEYLAGKNAMLISDQLKRINPQFINALRSGNPQAIANAQLAISRVEAGKTTIQQKLFKEYTSIFKGIQGSGTNVNNLRTAWEVANTNNNEKFTLYKDPSKAGDLETFQNLAFMENAYDGNTGSLGNIQGDLFRRVNGTVSGTANNGAPFSRQTNQRRLDGLFYGYNSEQDRPLFYATSAEANQKNIFQSYIDAVKANTASASLNLMATNAGNSNIGTFHNPVNTYIPSQVPSVSQPINNINTSTGSRSGSRPTG